MAGGTTTTNTNSYAWTRYRITHGFIPTYQGPGTDTPHYAVDIATPFHTPLTALLTGTVIKADYAVWNGQAGGGEVFIKANDGRTYYYYHLDQIGVHVGQSIASGQVVGLSGGQNSGGSHPTSPMWSTGPHTHVGFFTGYINTPDGSRSSGPDITSLIMQASSLPPGGTLDNAPPGGFTGGVGGLAGLGVPISVFVGGYPTGTAPGSSYNPFLTNTKKVFFSMGTTTQQVLNNIPGFYGVCLALDIGEQFPGIITCSTPTQDFTIGNVDTGIPNPFASVQNTFGDAFCTIFSTITGNALALMIRVVLIGLGVGLLLALMLRLALAPGGIVDTVGKVAPLLAAAA